jgi:hypothetical protein
VPCDATSLWLSQGMRISVLMATRDFYFCCHVRTFTTLASGIVNNPLSASRTDLETCQKSPNHPASHPHAPLALYTIYAWRYY